MEKLNKTINDFSTLQDLREKVNLTTYEVSEFLNCELEDFKKIEQGKRKLNILEAELLAELYGTTLHSITEAQIASGVETLMG